MEDNLNSRLDRAIAEFTRRGDDAAANLITEARLEIATLDYAVKAMQAMNLRMAEANLSDRRIRNDLQQRNNELLLELRAAREELAARSLEPRA